MVCSVRNSSQIDLEALRRYGICQEKKSIFETQHVDKELRQIFTIKWLCSH